MQVRTYDELSARLGLQFRWRLDELDSIRAGISAAKSDAETRSLVRGGVALLYAHWEGFIKEAAAAYLEYVAFQVKVRRTRVRDLAPPFLGLALAEMCPLDPHDRVWFTAARIGQFLRSDEDQRARIRTTAVVDTESNLTYRVLERILRALGLDASPYELKRHLIDRSLVEARNSIAHGEHFIVQKGDFMDLYDEFVPLLRDFKNQVENAAAQDSHALPAAPPSPPDSPT